MYPLCKILNTLNTPVMLICLVKQNDGTWVEYINVFYSTFTNVFYFCHVFFLRFLTFFIFSGTFFYVYGFGDIQLQPWDRIGGGEGDISGFDSNRAHSLNIL